MAYMGVAWLPQAVIQGPYAVVYAYQDVIICTPGCGVGI